MDGIGLDSLLDGHSIFQSQSDLDTNAETAESKNEKTKKNIRYLENESIEISGVKFYGSPYTPEFIGGFQTRDSQDANAQWSKIPSDCDVLISGHTHETSVKQYDGKFFINPGSATGAYTATTSAPKPSFILLAV